jgi:hypothetical protein
MMPNRTTGARLAVMAMLLAPACAPPRDRTGDVPTDARRLDGAWTVDFTLESPLLPGHMPARRTLRGGMALLRDPALAEQPGLPGRPTHSGSYATRFAPFGFEIGGSPVPELEARVAPGDSVVITLQPGAPAGVRMQGVLAGDSVTGIWLYDHDRGGAASGRFVMHRNR